jgi:hypothetical protein
MLRIITGKGTIYRAPTNGLYYTQLKPAIGYKPRIYQWEKKKNLIGARRERSSERLGHSNFKSLDLSMGFIFDF